MEYLQRCVVFIDILGFAKFIERSQFDQQVLQNLVDAIHSIRRPHFDEYLSQSALIVRGERNEEPRVTQFSDSIVISRRVKDLAELVLDAAQAVHALISHGLLCRGSVAVGSLIHDKQLLLGPAVIDAFKTEKAQPYPAILVSQSIREEMRKRGTGDLLEGTWINSHSVKSAVAMLHPLSDEYWFVDYFNDYPGVINYDDGSGHFRRMRELIVDRYMSADDEHVKDKYRWMHSHFNMSNLVKHGSVQPIVLKK